MISLLRIFLIFLLITSYSCVTITRPPNRTTKNEIDENEAVSLQNSLEDFNEFINSKKIVKRNSILYGRCNKLLKKIEENVARIFPKHRLDVDMYMIDSEDPILTTFPPDKLVISTAYMNSNSLYYAVDEEYLYGLLAHEYCHILFGHTQAKTKWRLMSKNNDGSIVENDSFFWINFLSPMKFRRDSMNDRVLPNALYGNWFFECSSDLFALKIMNINGMDPKKYLLFFKQIYDNPNSTFLDGELRKETKDRIERLSSYFLDYNSLEFFYDISELEFLEKVTGKYDTPIRADYLDLVRLEKDKDRKMAIYHDNFELYRSVSYWKFCCTQGEYWSKIYSNRTAYIVDPRGDYHKSGEYKFIEKDGYRIKVSKTTVPISIDGYPSFVFLQ